MFKDPVFSIGMIGSRSWGAMNLTWAVKYAGQAGGARIKMLKSPLPLHGLKMTGSCVDRRSLGAIDCLGTLIFVAPRFVDFVSVH